MASMLGFSYLLVCVLALCHGDIHITMKLLAPILDSRMCYLELKVE